MTEELLARKGRAAGKPFEKMRGSATCRLRVRVRSKVSPGPFLSYPFWLKLLCTMMLPKLPCTMPLMTLLPLSAESVCDDAADAVAAAVGGISAR